MKRITSTLTRSFVATLLFAAALMTTSLVETQTVIAQADCSRWDLSGEWKFVQTNNTSPVFTLQQTGTLLIGSATYPSYFHVIVKASVDGTIKGDSVDITAYWNNGTTGVYTGKIDSRGRILGSTYDRQHPQTIANWYSDRTAKCLTGTAGTGERLGTSSSSELKTTPEPGTIPKQGRVKLPSGTTTNPPRPICESARLARARNNPAAPGLEEKCRLELAAKGKLIAAADAVVGAARNAQPSEFHRFGFDIATAIFGNPALGAQGNTQTGPGSLGIRARLTDAGKIGFDVSVKLHLRRNYQP